MSKRLGIARRVASRAFGSDWMRIDSAAKGGGLYSLPPREENARVGRVANEARGKTRGNCAEIFGLRAKTYLRAFWSGRFDAAVARWPRRGFSKLRALFPPHTTARFFYVGIIDAMRFTNISVVTPTNARARLLSSIFPRQKRI